MAEPEEKKDIVEKEFLAYPDIAADTINALLYQGKTMTEAEKLWPGPTETFYQGQENLRNQFEDLSKYELEKGQVRIMYLIANQTETDGKMLFRKAGYTGGIYREQYERKMKNTFPVVELVLYWGKPRWRSSRSIRQLFRKQKITEEEWEYIDELNLHVYEMRYLPEETRKLFQSDMRIVTDFLAEGKSYYSDRKIIHKAALIKMLKVLSGDQDINGVEEWLREQKIREEDDLKVCELFDQYERKGRKEGLEKGKAEGKAEGAAEGMNRQLVADIENAMSFFHITLEKACEGLGTTVSRYEEAKSGLALL